MINQYLRYFIISALFFSFSFVNARAEEILVWQDCIKEAAKNHPDLIAAEEQVKQSEAAEKITASILFPQVTGSLNASTAKSGTDKAPANTADSYNYGVSGTQLIFDANKTVNNVRAAAENIKAYQENFRYTSATVRYGLRSAFINLLTAQENLEITQQIYDIRRGNLELITLRYESGLEHKGALLTAQADLADAQYKINLAKRNVEVYQRQLIKEMGRREFVLLAVKGNFSVRDSAKDKPNFATLTKNNPSLMQIIAQKNSAEFSLRAAYANFSPTLNAAAGANKSGTKWEPKGNQWNLGLSLSMPIFEGGLRFAQVAQARALLDQLQENERSIRDSLIYTLEQTWAALQDAQENVGVQKAQLIATEERSKIAQAQYSIGFISFDNWTIIEDNLVKAKSAYLTAQSAALLAEAKWIQAKGETLEYEN